MNGRLVRGVGWLATLAVAAGSGCGERSGLVPVAGVVTLDGDVLPNARLLFRPRSGRPSFGVTDAEGRYELRYTAQRPGAVPGEHAVSITTAGYDDKEQESGEKEILPSRYNAKTTLTATVDANRRTHDFALQSR